jgi:hypothetical protein
MNVAKQKAEKSAQISIVVLKGSPDYRDWLARFSEASRMPQSVLIDHALAKLAREQGFEPPPKR